MNFSTTPKGGFNLLILEIKRFINSKSVLYLLISICLIVVTNVVFEQVFSQDISVSNSQRLLNIYQSFSQFSFFILAPIIGGLISKDFKNKYIYFYYQNKISLSKYFFTKYVLTSFFVILFLSITLLIYQLVFPVELATFLLVYLILLLNLMYCITVGLLLSLVFRRKNSGTMAMIFFFFIISIVNLFPIPHIRGFMSVIDTNSFSTAYVHSLLGTISVSLNFPDVIELTNWNLMLSIFLPIAWILLFLTLAKLEIKRMERSGYYV